MKKIGKFYFYEKDALLPKDVLLIQKTTEFELRPIDIESTLLKLNHRLFTTLTLLSIFYIFFVEIIFLHFS